MDTREILRKIRLKARIANVPGRQAMDGPTKLPRRQQQVLDHLRCGYAEKQIARLLSLSQHTVHVYVKALYRRFGVTSLGELLSHWASRDDCPACGTSVDPQGAASSQGSVMLASRLEEVSQLLLTLLKDAEAALVSLECRAEIAQALASTYAAAHRSKKNRSTRPQITETVETISNTEAKDE